MTSASKLLLLVPAFAFAGCNADKKEPPPAPAAASATTTTLAPVPASAWRVEVLPQAWTFTGFVEDSDLSGIAAWDAQHCLICTDEKHSIQPGIMDRSAGTVAAGAKISLLPGAGKKDEADAEGVAAAKEQNCYYVTGSHGVAKKSGEPQPSRCHVIRIPVNPATGEPQEAGVQVGSLQPWLEKDPVLGPSFGKSLQHDGMNIEGLAWKDGKLWFGVRAPNIGGDAFVIEADAASLFTGAPQATLHRFPVGAGLGIREIAALRDGFLVLTGEANSDVGPDSEFRLFQWKPGAAAQFIGVVPSPSAKAEGLLVLNEEEKQIDVLVVFDSAPAGGPKAYRLTKP